MPAGCAARRGVMLILSRMMQRCQLTVNLGKEKGRASRLFRAIETEWDGLCAGLDERPATCWFVNRHRRVC